MNNRQKLPLGGLLSIERAILAELIGNHMSNDKIEGAIARNCELQLKKSGDTFTTWFRGGIKKIDFFLGNSPKQRTPPTHRYGLGLT